MLRGFRDFVSRGNVVDLAVGVVIGAAFTTVVNQFTNSFLTPLINMVGGTKVNGKINLPGPGFLDWGAFISTVIGFVITASVVYFLVVVPMNRLAQMRKTGEVEESAAPSEEVRLLMEIRDALVAQRASGDDAKPVPAQAPSASSARARS